MYTTPGQECRKLEPRAWGFNDIQITHAASISSGKKDCAIAWFENLKNRGNGHFPPKVSSPIPRDKKSSSSWLSLGVTPSWGDGLRGLISGVSADGLWIQFLSERLGQHFGQQTAGGRIVCGCCWCLFPRLRFWSSSLHPLASKVAVPFLMVVLQRAESLAVSSQRVTSASHFFRFACSTSLKRFFLSPLERLLSTSLEDVGLVFVLHLSWFSIMEACSTRTLVLLSFLLMRIFRRQRW